MYKIFLLYIATGTMWLFIILMPQSASAAQLIFKTVPDNAVDSTAKIIEVRIDPQSEDLNVVEGIINFQGTISDKLSVEVETGDSLLTLWPTPPQYFAVEKNIHFSGGVPGGFSREGLLFRIRLSSSLSGDETILWNGGTAYLNDGKGTQENINAESIVVSLNQQNKDAVKISSNNKLPVILDLKKDVIIALVFIITLFVLFGYAHKNTIKK
jgi:hypothetical protein